MALELLGDRGLPWTEEDYLALAKTRDRVELIDGSLIVTPAPTPFHQDVSWNLTNVFRRPARDAGLRVYEAVNVRLRQGRIPIPDLVIVEPIDPNQPVIDASAVRLVAEIVSRHNVAADTVLKMKLYADAGIPWYLLVKPTRVTVMLELFRLDRGSYVRHDTAAPDLPLVMTEPVSVRIDPKGLISG